MSDMFTFDDIDNDDEEERESKESNPVKQLRTALKAAQKQAKESKKELEELRSFKETYEHEQRVSNSSKVFEKFGLTQKHAELFLKVNPEAEVNDDSVKTFAEEYALPFKAPEGAETGEAPEPDTAPFVPADVGTTGGAGLVTREQLDAMYKTDPQRAISILKSGRVRWNNDDAS